MTIDLGKVAITAGGNWKNNVTYEALTLVVFAALDGGDGCGYISLKNNLGVTPGTDETTWKKAAEAGQSIYTLCVAHGTFVGTEEEFVAAYNDAVTAATNAAEAKSSATGCVTVRQCISGIMQSEIKVPGTSAIMIEVRQAAKSSPALNILLGTITAANASAEINAPRDVMITCAQ